MGTQTLSGASRGLHRRVSEPEWVEGVCAGSTPGVGVGAQVGWGGLSRSGCWCPHGGRPGMSGRGKSLYSALEGGYESSLYPGPS